jgi:hypothetical protein
MSDDWVPVSASEAFRHPLYGVRGWAVVLAAVMALGVVLSLYTYFFSGALWILDSRGTPAMRAAFAIMLFGSDAAVLWLLHGLLSHEAWFRRAFVNVAVARMLALVGMVLWMQSYEVTTPGVRAFIVMIAPVASELGVQIAYVLKSRRIAVTCLHCVTAMDLLQVRKPAAAGGRKDGKPAPGALDRLTGYSMPPV